MVFVPVLALQAPTMPSHCSNGDETSGVLLPLHTQYLHFLVSLHSQHLFTAGLLFTLLLQSPLPTFLVNPSLLLTQPPLPVSDESCLAVPLHKFPILLGCPTPQISYPAWLSHSTNFLQLQHFPFKRASTLSFLNTSPEMFPFHVFKSLRANFTVLSCLCKVPNRTVLSSSGFLSSSGVLQTCRHKGDNFPVIIL